MAAIGNGKGRIERQVVLHQCRERTRAFRRVTGAMRDLSAPERTGRHCVKGFWRLLRGCQVQGARAPPSSCFGQTPARTDGTFTA